MFKGADILKRAAEKKLATGVQNGLKNKVTDFQKKNTHKKLPHQVLGVNKETMQKDLNG